LLIGLKSPAKAVANALGPRAPAFRRIGDGGAVRYPALRPLIAIAASLVKVCDCDILTAAAALLTVSNGAARPARDRFSPPGDRVRLAGDQLSRENRG
jgi:hypothetical protein